MKNNKTAQRDQARKEPVQAGDSAIGLAVGLSLSVLFGVVTDNIGLGMITGVAVGLCVSPAVGMLRRNRGPEEQENDEEKQ